MRQCIFPSCKLRPDDRIGNMALVHRFPREEHIRKLWVQWIREKCGMPDFIFSYKAGLCYRHFDRQCYHRSNGLLKPFSYPSFTPQDLDNISIIGSSAKEISMNGIPKTNLIIKLDPTLVRNNASEKSDPGKKFVLLVTDKKMQTSQAPNSSFSLISQKQPAFGVVGSQGVPPLRLIGRDKTAVVAELAPLNQESSTAIRKNTSSLLKPSLSGGVTCLSPSSNFTSIQKNVCFPQEAFSGQFSGEEQSSAACQADQKSLTGSSISRSPRTLNVLHTVLDSSRRRIHGYRRRLQQEKKKMIRLEKLLEEMKEKQLISVAAAERIEAVLHDD